LPDAFYLGGLATLLPLFLDAYQIPQFISIVSGRYLPSVIDTPEREAYMGRVAFSLGRRLPTMPSGTLQWRLEHWLLRGSAEVSPSRLAALACRVLVVVGSADKALPSLSEASALAAVLPDAAVFVVEGAGHSATLGSRCDLAAVMRARFAELQGPGLRVAMKKGADVGGTYFGMETRNHPSLNPLDYWKPRYNCHLRNSEIDAV
jgi:pimeloyl-ACP methyl ester carboxylesterase